MVHCFKGEVPLERVQEMVRWPSLCDWPGCDTKSRWIGGKGPGTETNPSKRDDCILDDCNYNTSVLYVCTSLSEMAVQSLHTHTHLHI